MSEQQKLLRQKKITKYVLLMLTVLFITVMLVVPLASILYNSLKEGIGYYISSITTDYVKSALFVTLLATVIAVIVNTFFGICAAWLLTKFSFKGKQILATLIDIPFSISPVIVGLSYLMTFGRLGWFYPVIRMINEWLGTNIRITFAIPGVVLATIFVTFPFVSRELIPVLNATGKDEEEAAALMGAKGFTIFRRITLPQMKWGLKLTGLSGMEKRYPNQLSGGQRQRVAFARALAPNPQVLLLDEPFAAIDAKVRTELRTWLKEMVETLGITSIFVTHGALFPPYHFAGSRRERTEKVIERQGADYRCRWIGCSGGNVSGSSRCRNDRNRRCG